MTHEKMPEALRLAEHLKNFRSFPDDIAAAAELERQHAEIERLRAEVDGLVGLLRESLATHEAWSDLAPAFSLCADIRKAINSALQSNKVQI